MLRYGSISSDKLFQAPREVQESFEKQSALLLKNLYHPSLRAKKYDQRSDLWQARVNYSWRFYFRIAGELYLLDEIKHDPK